jgi:predicted nucleic acid-binding protein
MDLSAAVPPHVCSLVWLNRQSDTALFRTSVTVMELRFGVERLAEGKRRADLWELLEFTLSRLFGPLILFFDVPAATEVACIAAVVEAAGTPIGQADAQIAAIARSHGFAIATRNTARFQSAGLVVINPWEFA